ncbi:hypothetical protein FRX31_024698 [Thalictrum thalictroides]|uniref:Uncharacterized protein n=1 Tax=Thalictrum thalictroides TaxID=46969 RepID=A0A7J6VKT1_THATH|nr:hypothetical protein FRX31_024698 [Thalictrum thalictroides]
MISDDGVEYWLKHIINNVDGGIFTVIKQAVSMAVRDHPEELKHHRGKIIEKLFTYGEQHHNMSSGFHNFDNKSVEKEEETVQNIGNMNYYSEEVDQQSCSGDNEKILSSHHTEEDNVILSNNKYDQLKRELAENTKKLNKYLEDRERVFAESTKKFKNCEQNMQQDPSRPVIKFERVHPVKRG